MISQLSKLKISSLNQIALLCGLPVPSPSTKAARVASLVSGLSLVKLVPSANCNVLAIDIGIKNFSFCSATYPSLDIPSRANVSRWSKLDLHSAYGRDYVPVIAPDSPLDSRRYLNHLCVSVTDDLVKHIRPDIVVLEVQRTRSNNNSITLPNVLLNYTFESILHSNLTNRNLLVLPIHSTSMASFWINRFFKKASLASKKSAASAKAIRSVLFFDSILPDPNLVSVPGFAPDPSLSLAKKSAALLDHLQVDPASTKKVDDLIDSLLYNLTISSQLYNQQLLLKYLDNDQDLSEFIWDRNLRQLSLLKPLIDRFDLTLTDDFLPYESSL